MSTTDHGGERGAMPLSPCTMKELRQVVADGPQSLVDVQYAGLTIREEFAKAAMQGLCANPNFTGNREDYAETAIQRADALLAALSGGRT